LVQPSGRRARHGFLHRVSDEEQERRFQGRIRQPHKRWKLSEIDLQARAHWVDYSEAKDEMFAFTDTEESPWWVVEADDKRSARLNVISHLLGVLPYERLRFDDVTLPPRQQRAYVRPPKADQVAVPVRYEVADRRKG
jgi:polyphosphate kinase 2 (PPK2 family)